MLALEQYLLEKDILVSNKRFKGGEELIKDNILEQIIFIISIQNILQGYHSNENKIRSTIGKKIETLKVEYKYMERSLITLKNKKNKNNMDMFLLSHGEEMLERLKILVINLKEVNFLDLVDRSMKKNEICLGRVDESNLRVFECLEIGTLKYCTYNLVEEDMYTYIKRIVKRGFKGDIEELIDEFISLSHLKGDSDRYIKLLLSIPFDTLKVWNRYIMNKKNISSDEYLDSIKNTMSYENVNFI